MPVGQRYDLSDRTGMSLEDVQALPRGEVPKPEGAWSDDAESALPSGSAAT